MKYKDLRISALQPNFRNGRFRFVDHSYVGFDKGHMIKNKPVLNWRGEAEDTIESFFEDEYTKYPNSEHDDVLDVLSRCVDLDVGVQMEGPDSEEERKKMVLRANLDSFSQDVYQPY